MTPCDGAAVERLLELIHERYHYDFRGYSRSSMVRRLARGAAALGCEGPSQLEDALVRDSAAFSRILPYLTVPVSDMFRDPPFFGGLREKVFPFLCTFPFPRIWVAGCSTGEEVYALAILLREAGLLERTRIYATDIQEESLEVARRGIYALKRIAGFSEAYRAAGGRGSLADHYTAAYDGALFDASVRDSIVFCDHSLTTDAVFAEVQLVTCRNVLIYFDAELQARAVGLFRDALSHRAFLGLGARESLLLTTHERSFEPVSRELRIYRKR